EERFPSVGELLVELRKWAANEPVLPMDEKGDAGYQRFVAQLEGAEGSSDSVFSVAPGRGRRRDRSSSVVRANSGPAAEPWPAWLWWVTALLGLGIVALVTMVLIALLQ